MVFLELTALLSRTRQVSVDCKFLEENGLMDYSFLVGVHDRMRTVSVSSMEGEKMNIRRLASDVGEPGIFRRCESDPETSGIHLACEESAVDRQGIRGHESDRVDLKAVWARYDAEVELEADDYLRGSKCSAKVPNFFCSSHSLLSVCHVTDLLSIFFPQPAFDLLSVYFPICSVSIYFQPTFNFFDSAFNLL